jgi:nitrogen fixation NifU-like protein
MTISTIVMAIVVLTALALVGFGVHYYLHPHIDNPDGIATITGPCGDTMEIALKFNGPRLEDIYCRTNGCSISKMCVETACALARGKTVEELKKIDRAAIQEKVGNLPETHVHCALLAEMTLQKAVENYILKLPPLSSDPPH